jgi:hypothetical protein
MADLEANFMHLQLMHESLSRFGESFASFLYGLNMRAFCVDFPEVSYTISAWKTRLGAVLTGSFTPGSNSGFNQAVQQAAAISRSARDVYPFVTTWNRYRHDTHVDGRVICRQCLDEGYAKEIGVGDACAFVEIKCAVYKRVIASARRERGVWKRC